MHPVLFDLPLPTLTVPLGPALVVVAIVGMLVAVLGLRARAFDLVTLGVVVAVTGVASSVRFRGQAIVTGPLPLYGFGVLLTTGLIAGWLLAQRLAVKDGASRDAVAKCYFATAVAGLVGARFLYVLTNLRDFSSLTDALAFREGGLVFYGGVLGGIAGSVLALRGTPLGFFAWSDIAAPCLALGAALGRVGCYLAGCDYGVPLGAHAPAFLTRLGTFPRWPDGLAGPGAGSPAWVEHVLTRGLPLDSRASLPVHPTQLYESAALAALLVLVLAVRKQRRFAGEAFLVFVAGYGAVRFLVETCATIRERGLFGPAGPPAVLFSFGVLILGVALVPGASRAVVGRRGRAAVRVLGLVAAPLLFVALRGSTRDPAPLSTSQWIALVSSIVVAALWSRLDVAPKIPPEPPGFTGDAVSS